jgi:regulator of protease activity HflC (stomatin/prohibitin superfamily)
MNYSKKHKKCKEEKKMDSNKGIRSSTTIKIGLIVGLIIVGLVAFIHGLGILTLQGNEAAVQQNWRKGVMPDVLLSGTHFYNGWTSEVFRYNIGTQKCTFDDKSSNQDPQFDRIVVDCGENGGQKAWIAMSINYRLGWMFDNKGVPVFSPEKLVKFHKDGLRTNYDTVILKRTVVDIVNKIARPHEALDIYSGKGFVKFKDDVDKELKGHHVFAERGILVENTIIYKVYLDAAYEKEIAEKVLAIQTKLKKEQQTLAANEEAKRVFAESQAAVESKRQEAEAMKIQKIKEAEANKEQQILAAQAEKQKRVLEAEGERDANLAKASGIMAVGKADADVIVLKTNALYAGEGGARRAAIDLATAQAEKMNGMFRGVSIVPEKTILNAGKQLGLTVTDDQK